MFRHVIKPVLLALCFALSISAAQAAGSASAAPRVLIAVTSHDALGATGEATGYYLSEVAHAYYAFQKAGFDVVFTSPRGGKPPVTGLDVEDAENTRFLEDKVAQAAISHSTAAGDVKASAFDAIYYAGGHGVMWDFADDADLQAISRTIYEKGGVVSAVCHGPAALVNITLSDGTPLVAGKTISTFTNEEEAAINLENVVPFALETALVERGATVEKAGLFKEKVVVDGSLVTGQNPASAKAVAREVIGLLKTR